MIAPIIGIIFILSNWTDINNNNINAMDRIWLSRLAKLYKVSVDEGPLTTSTIDELWKRVDIVPPSLALGQGAEESG
jgi:uncharacterized FlgJ-related protein